jgi:hypothetical protein
MPIHKYWVAQMPDIWLALTAANTSAVAVTGSCDYNVTGGGSDGGGDDGEAFTAGTGCMGKMRR